MKYCKYCDTDKLLDDFNRSASANDERQNKCRTCERVYRENNRQRRKENSDRYRAENKDELKAKNDIWRANNKEKTAEMNRDWRRRRPEVSRAQKQRYYKENKEKINEYRKQWRKENIDKVREYHRKHAAEQRRTNPQYALRHRLTIRVREVLKGSYKSKSVEALTGCSYNELKKHMESKFTEGMTWKLFLQGKIQIDHIRPCCSFDLTKPEEQAICFHYTNLQPLWPQDNKKKLSEDLKMKKARMLEKDEISSV